jgi:Phospholipase_D-nuclease N-terminal
MVLLEIVELFLVLIVVVPWLWVLYDALRWSGTNWTMAGKAKVPWVLFILLLPPFGVLTYLIVVRPELVAAGSAAQAGNSTGGLSTAGTTRDPAAEVNPLLLMRRNTVVAIGLLLAAIAIAGVLGVLRLWQLA